MCLQVVIPQVVKHMSDSKTKFCNQLRIEFEGIEDKQDCPKSPLLIFSQLKILQGSRPD
jgi:hypothetical protein